MKRVCDAIVAPRHVQSSVGSVVVSIQSPIVVAAVSFEQLKSIAAGLSVQATPEEVDALLHAVAKSGLSPVAREQIIEAIHVQTKVPKKILREQVAAAALGLGVAVEDKAHQLASLTLEKRFAAGAHLKSRL